MTNPLIVEVTRGGIVESRHTGAYAVVNAAGEIVASAGDIAASVYPRSAIKAFQCLAMLESGAADRFGFTPEEIALACSSHNGEPAHVAVARAMLAKASTSEENYECGAHWPIEGAAHDAAVRALPAPLPVHNNCSGKHAGMLAHCVACGYGKDDYLATAHPLQREIRRAVATMTGCAESDLREGIDGCSAPNYALPLGRLALAFARLADDGGQTAFDGAPRTLAGAMRRYPEMVSGEGRSDLALTRAGAGDWVCKVGAEGVQAIGIRSRGLGIAIKIDDGGRRGLLAVTREVLAQAGLLEAGAREALAAHERPAIRNYRGIVTGALTPLFVLDNQNRMLASTAATDHH